MCVSFFLILKKETGWNMRGFRLVVSCAKLADAEATQSVNTGHIDVLDSQIPSFVPDEVLRLEKSTMLQLHQLDHELTCMVTSNSQLAQKLASLSDISSSLERTLTSEKEELRNGLQSKLEQAEKVLELCKSSLLAASKEKADLIVKLEAALGEKNAYKHALDEAEGKIIKTESMLKACKKDWMNVANRHIRTIGIVRKELRAKRPREERPVRTPSPVAPHLPHPADRSGTTPHRFYTIQTEKEAPLNPLVYDP